MDDAIAKLNSLKGSLKRHVTDEEIHAVREEVFNKNYPKDI